MKLNIKRLDKRFKMFAYAVIRIRFHKGEEDEYTRVCECLQRAYGNGNYIGRDFNHFGDINHRTEKWYCSLRNVTEPYEVPGAFGTYMGYDRTSVPDIYLTSEEQMTLVGLS